MPDNIIKSTGEQLFDLIAEWQFMEEHNLTVSSHFLLFQLFQTFKKYERKRFIFSERSSPARLQVLHRVRLRQPRRRAAAQRGVRQEECTYLHSSTFHCSRNYSSYIFYTVSLSSERLSNRRSFRTSTLTPSRCSMTPSARSCRALSTRIRAR